MYIIVRPRAMVLVIRLHMIRLVSVMNACAVGYLVLLFFVQRHALVFVQVWMERTVKRQCLFLRSKDKQTPSTRMCPPQQVNTE